MSLPLAELEHIEQDERVYMSQAGDLFFAHVEDRDSRSDYCCFAAFPRLRTIVQKMPMKLTVRSCKSCGACRGPASAGAPRSCPPVSAADVTPPFTVISRDVHRAGHLWVTPTMSQGLPNGCHAPVHCGFLINLQAERERWERNHSQLLSLEALLPFPNFTK